ncbi:hypothetical protein B0H17DRAFT_580971 [Mycena rosella]|uniref:F-box domain-containing protein n=1 Tax=Mycena rosella TaxID=1033263 RepID=A0AAD7DG48_MYCRO|nr:hypothetical protein B0H17DRAFT_580971 [Mycena rosella]
MGEHGFLARAARFFDSLCCRPTPDADPDDDSTLVEYDAVCHIKSLPDPVLGAIFKLSKRAAQEAPVERVVSHVSAHWRGVALCSPELWAAIDAHGSAENQRELLHWYLSKSAGHPLDVRIALSQESWAGGAGPLLLADVLADATRLRSLSIHADFLGADAAVRALCRSVCAPRLERLTFIFLEQPLSDLDIIVAEDFSPAVFTGGAPQLAVLRLQHLEQALFPPLEGVTTLHLEEYTCPPMAYSRFCALLRALPALANLSVYGDVVASWSATADIRLPQLRSLRVARSAQAGRMLLSLDARALTSLFLKDIRDAALTAFWMGLERAEDLRFPALQILSLDGPMGARALAPLLLEFSGVTELRLVNCDADDALGMLNSWADGPRSVLVHRVRDVSALDRLSTRGVAMNVHCDVAWGRAGIKKWERLAPWPAELDRADADDLFMQLRNAPVI